MKYDLDVISHFCEARHMTFVVQPTDGRMQFKLYINNKIRAIGLPYYVYSYFGTGGAFFADPEDIDRVREEADAYGVTPLLIVSFNGPIHYLRMNGWEFFPYANPSPPSKPIYKIPWTNWIQL